MTFGEKLQALRKERHISQEQLAENLNVSRQTISKWERDLATPDTDSMIRLSRFFEVPMEYFLYEACEYVKITESFEKTKIKSFNFCKFYCIIGIALILLSICSTYIAKLYDKIINNCFYDNALNYLREFPLLYLLLLGIVLFLIGMIKQKSDKE